MTPSNPTSSGTPRCQFCGSAKHALANCTLPGAVSYRAEFPSASEPSAARTCARCGKVLTNPDERLVGLCVYDCPTTATFAAPTPSAPTETRAVHGVSGAEFADMEARGLLRDVYRAPDAASTSLEDTAPPCGRPAQIGVITTVCQLDEDHEGYCRYPVPEQPAALPGAPDRDLDGAPVLAHRLRQPHSPFVASEAARVLESLAARLRQSEEYRDLYHRRWKANERMWGEAQADNVALRASVRQAEEEREALRKAVESFLTSWKLNALDGPVVYGAVADLRDALSPRPQQGAGS